MITIQNVTRVGTVPSLTLLRRWAKYVLNNQSKTGDLTVRIVDPAEMTLLNETYRHKKGPTNVLSFPAELPPNLSLKTMPLGDIVICAEIVAQEAATQHKSLQAHWAHMLVHGILHLLGFDHQLENEAIQMETLEINLLQHFGFSNPYESGESTIHE